MHVEVFPDICWVCFVPSKINGGNLSEAPLSCTPNYSILNIQIPFYSGTYVDVYTGHILYVDISTKRFERLWTSWSVHIKSKHVIKVYIHGCIDIIITHSVFLDYKFQIPIHFGAINDKFLVVSFTLLMSYWRWHIDNPICTLLKNSKWGWIHAKIERNQSNLIYVTAS